MATSVSTIGFKEFVGKLDNMTDDLMEEFDLEILEAARDWEGRAKQDAPVDQGQLVGLIKADTEVTVISPTNHAAEVTSAAEYSAFVEWGTKTKVRVPAGLQAYAETFRGGKMRAHFVRLEEAKTMIYAWMNRVGIPKQFQWIVFINIVVKGINPHPFFFIQEPIVEKEFYGHLQNILETEH